MATITDVLLDTAERFAGRPALVDGDRVLAWDELYATALRGAAALADLGVEAGDRVALWAPNSAAWVIAELAILCAGAVVVPVNSRYTLDEAADIVTRARCPLVMAAGPGPVAAIADTAPRTVNLTGASPDGSPAWPDLLAGAGQLSGPVRRDPQDVSHIQFTSGTTGRPKGALLVHAAMVATTRSWTAIVGIEAGDRYPVVAPFSHVAGHKSGILASVVTGATLRPLPDTSTLPELIAAGEATILQGAPAMYGALLATLEQQGLTARGVKVAVAGAAVVPPSLVRRLRQVLGVRAVLNGYGLSEATGVCAITRPDDPEDIVTTSCGRAVPGVELRIVDPAGRELGPGEPGEVEVRGINVMRGYLDDPDATAAAMDGAWLRTGDVGTIDNEGNLRIVDRLKDLLTVGGYNVSPAEVERVLSEDPTIGEVAVVGAPDPRMGEVPVAFVVPAAGFDPDAAEARARQHLAGFKVPRTYRTVAALPLTAAGKVDKRSLRELL